MLRANPPLHLLPSGLPILSLAARGSEMLAIDTSHSVFFSTDAGAHWKSIAAHWNSRAVKVTLVSFSPPSYNPQGMAGAGVLPNPAHPSIQPAPNPGELAPAAGTATITGIIQDPTGARIPGAVVVVTQTATHLSRTVHTNSNGRYIVAGLAPDTYSVEAREPGFMTWSSPAVSVSQSQRVVTNITLPVGAVAQSVIVAPAPALKTKPAPSQPPPARPAAAGMPSPVFQITTEDGAQWISSNGLTWKRK